MNEKLTLLFKFSDLAKRFATFVLAASLAGRIIGSVIDFEQNFRNPDVKATTDAIIEGVQLYQTEVYDPNLDRLFKIIPFSDSFGTFQADQVTDLASFQNTAIAGNTTIPGTQTPTPTPTPTESPTPTSVQTPEA